MSERIFQPTRESLATHRVPEWYDDAKLGIFIHWSVSSVPGFAPRSTLEQVLIGEGQAASPYAEWYWNSLKLPGSAVQRHHRETYGDLPYERFADDYRAGLEQWQPAEWARAFRAAGARYVVLVTKHHDGFCLWPSEVEHPDPRWCDWHTGRDVVGELAAAVRAEGMRFGVYYSGGLDWTFDDRPLEGLIDLFTKMPGGAYPAYAAAQVRELIERVAPDVLWNDISWPDRKQKLWELIADYYEAVPEGVVNDRWMHRSRLMLPLRFAPLARLVDRALRKRMATEEGMASPPPPTVYDYRTPEYASFDEIQAGKWECVRGIDMSFGYNENSRPEDFLSHEDLLHSFVDIVSKNGNLLLNVGPRGRDAQIPDIQLQRLRWLGAYLGDASEAIHGSRPWRRAEGETREGIPVRFTQREGVLYATLLGRPTTRAVTLVDVPVHDPGEVKSMGDLPTRAVSSGGGDWTIEIQGDWPDRPAHTLRLGRCAG